MDDQTRAAFDEMREEMRRGFAAVDSRFDRLDEKIETVRREAGVISEDLRSRLELVAEIVGSNAKALDRVHTDMTARFRENEIVLRATFRDIRRRR